MSRANAALAAAAGVEILPFYARSYISVDGHFRFAIGGKGDAAVVGEQSLDDYAWDYNGPPTFDYVRNGWQPPILRSIF